MKVSELGEFGLVERIERMIASTRDNTVEAWKQLILGIGDDCAVWRGDVIQLVTTDSLVQDIHFSLDTATWGELGWKALAINLSDIAAMGGTPKYALVSLALPDETEVDDVIAFYQGMLDIAKQFKVAIIGGDTDSVSRVAINVTVIGSADSQDRLLTRSAAKPGEKVVVTGYLGGAAAGLEMLTRHLSFNQETTSELRKACLRPYPRVAEGQKIVELGGKTGIDISDGLISDLRHVCQASHVGVRIEVDRVPINPAVKANFGSRALELALSGGEDYELLFTATAGIIEKVKASVACPVTIIGEITEDETSKITLVDGKWNPVNLSKAGWEHFTPKRGQV